MAAGPFPYSTGTLYEFGSPDPNGFNAWFREGVLIPEPSSGVLVLVGAAGVWWAKRRLRRPKNRHLLLILIVTGTLGSCRPPGGGVGMSARLGAD